MGRGIEGGTYLGGISTMLIHAEVCPTCGGVHSDARRLGMSFRLPVARDCPLSTGSLGPTLARAPEALESSPSFALPELQDPPAEVTLTIPRRAAEELAAPWPVPLGVD